MVYIAYGQDRNAVLSAIDKYCKKHNISTRRTFSEHNWSIDDFEAEISSFPLFGDPDAIVVDGINWSKKTNELERVLDISQQNSTRLVVLIGDDEIFTQDIIDIVTPRATSIANHKKAKPADDKRSFALADALGERDRKKAWLIYRGMIDDGIAAEEIHGTIFWLYKNLYLVYHCSEKDAGLHAFVYSKAKKNAKNFTTDEVKSRIMSLVNLYHASRRGEGDLESVFEQFILAKG